MKPVRTRQRLNARYLKLASLAIVILVFLLFTRSYSSPGPTTVGIDADHNREGSCDRWMASHESMESIIIDPQAERPDQNTVPTVRTFNHCVFKQGAQCTPYLESKIYDWLSGVPPLLSNSEAANVPAFAVDTGECYTVAMKRNLKGRGLVLTATNSHFKALLNLIVLLRVLDTSLSLQVVHKGEIEDFTRERLLLAAESDWLNNKDIQSLLHNTRYKPNLPKVNLSFLDVSPAIKLEYLPKFVRFNNKLLANFFSTFEESILIDTDTIFLRNPDEFLHFDEYRAKGAFFFKDRALENGHKAKDSIERFMELLPTSEESTKYGIPQITDYTLKNRFFSGYLHLQESGVVLINKLRHFETTLMAVTLGLHQNSIGELIWGDKELYWLSFIASGSEDYHFNPNHAASIGELTPDSKHSHYPHIENIKELCSSHPAHIAKDNHTLLWMNSGFRHCKKTMYLDSTDPFFRDWSDESVKKYNTGPVQIRAAIIPPENINVKLPHSVRRPTRGWEPKDYCEMYTICAYADVEGAEDKGNVVEFSKEEQNWFDYLAYCWFSSVDILTMLIRDVEQ